MVFHLNSSDDADFLVSEVFLICHPPFETCVPLFDRVDHQPEFSPLSCGYLPCPCGYFCSRELAPSWHSLLPAPFTCCRIQLSLRSAYHPCGLHQAYQVEFLLDAYGVGFPFTPADVWVM